MKLLKKLVPLTVLATTASIVTPVVTSCSNSSKWDIDWNKKDGRYVPEVDIHETPESGSMSKSDAIKAYFDAIKDDHKVFAQDLAYWHLLYGESIAGESFLDVLQIKVNDIVKDDDVQDTYRVSYKLHMEGKLTPDPSAVYEIFDIDFNSVPYSIIETDPSGSNNRCCLTISGIKIDSDGYVYFDDELLDWDDWSIDVTYSNLTSTRSTTIDNSNLGDYPTDDLNGFVVMLGAMGISPDWDIEEEWYYYEYVPTYYMSKVKLASA